MAGLPREQEYTILEYSGTVCTVSWKFNIRDLDYASGHMPPWKCDLVEVIGVYQVQVYSDNQIKFVNKGDRCGPFVAERQRALRVPYEWVIALPETP